MLAEHTGFLCVQLIYQAVNVLLFREWIIRKAKKKKDILETEGMLPSALMNW